MTLELITATILPTGTITEVDQQTLVETKIVYQRVNPLLGNRGRRGDYAIQRRAHVIPFDPQTGPQLTRRSLFNAAIIAWQSMSPEERAAYEPLANLRHISAYNQFISEYMLNPPAQPGSIWDGGASTWDSGASAWPE